jgi:gas vesicle protein
MSRMRLALTVTAASVAASAVGYGLGMLFAPASGTETRRRLAWRAQHEYRSRGRTCERMFERAATRARQELQARSERVFEQVGKECAR